MSGKVSCNWRKGNITPVCKKGRKEHLGNYMPVSLMSVPWKMMKQIHLEDTLRRMQNKEVIHDSLHCFTQGRSCLTNLVAFCNEAEDWIGRQKKRATDVMYQEFCKTFGMI